MKVPIISADVNMTRRSLMIAGGAALLLSLWRPAVAATGLNTRTAGTQDPTFIFVHGFTCSLEDYQAQIDALSDSYRCAGLDLPGHGNSPMPQSYRMEALAATVNEVKRKCGARKVILVGHSMGVRVVREAYRQSAEGVCGLVFLDGSIYRGDEDVLIKRLRDRIRQVGYPAYVKSSFSEMFVEGSDPGLRDKLLVRAMEFNPTYAENLLADNIRWELEYGTASIKEIAVPVMLLQSTYTTSQGKRVSMTDDVKTPFMELVAKVVPNAEIRTITGIGHFTMIEAAGKVNRCLRNFAERVS